MRRRSTTSLRWRCPSKRSAAESLATSLSTTWAYTSRVRTRTALRDDVAGLLQRVALEKEQFDVPGLAPVIGGRWGDVSLDGLWGPLRTDGPSLVWEPSVRSGAPEDAQARLVRLDALRNASAGLELADGKRVVAQYGHTPRYGSRAGAEPGFTCEFDVWHTEGGSPAVRWVGRLKGGGFLNGNLAVSAGSRSRASSMRLAGCYTWHLLIHDRNDDLSVVVDGGPSTFNRQALGIDFNALQVSLGAPLQLDLLVGLDGPGNVVGAAGVHFGGNRKTKRTGRADGPVPDDVVHECWVPVFFQRLATAMVATPDLPWGMACNAYLDSLSDATIDGRYLHVHVALEAFATALLKLDSKKKGKPRLLVKNGDAWVRWVSERASEIREMLAAAEQEKVFVNKVISAMNLPSSGVVADALSRLDPPLLVDEAVLEEVEKRNIPVHHAAMNKPGVDYEVDRDVARIDVLKSLFIALIARACKYDGAIAGWVRDEAAAWKPQPGWWPAPSPGTLAEARVMFAAGERERPRSTRPKRFQSRLLKRSSRSR